MIVRNTSGSPVSLPFVAGQPIIGANQTIEIADAFANHPQLLQLVNANIVEISDVAPATSAESQLANLPSNAQKQALNASTSPNTSNPYITKSVLESRITTHQSDPLAHHSNANDPTSNEKEAMRLSSNPSGQNPFITQTASTAEISAAISAHLAAADHSPTPLTQDQVDAIAASTAPSSGNAMVTVSVLNAQITADISTHTSDADAHHDNSNDPTAAQKAAMDAAASPDATNAFFTANEQSSHVADPDAHHDNSNDPSVAEKAAMANSSAPGAGNPFMTQSAVGTQVSSDISTHASDADAHHDNSNDPTSDEKDAMTNSSAPAAGNPFMTQSAVGTQISSDISTHASDADAHHSNVNDPTTAQKAALDAATTPGAGNAFVTQSVLDAHAASATAHHSNANDPTSDQKAAMDASSSPGAGNAFVTVSADAAAIASHAAIATAHHSNANDPSSDEKAALAGTDGTPAVGNKYVTDSDPRNSDSRTPTAHAASHTDGSDDIQSATSSQKGLMPALSQAAIDELITSINDVRLERFSTTVADLVGVRSKKIYINGEIVDLSTKYSIDVVDNLIDGTGTEIAATPMVADTTYNLYCSNSSATDFPNDLRGSTTAAIYDAANDKLMLGTSGNAQNWAFVGQVRTNASTQFADEFAVASEYNEPVRSKNIVGSGTVGPASSNDTFEKITDMEQDILALDTWIVKLEGSVPLQATNVGTDLDLGVDDGGGAVKINTADEPIMASNVPLAGSYQYTSSGNTYKNYSLQHAYSNVTGSQADPSQGNLTVTRIPNKV